MSAEKDPVLSPTLLKMNVKSINEISDKGGGNLPCPLSGQSSIQVSSFKK
jgi:hypothetical protein